MPRSRRIDPDELGPEEEETTPRRRRRQDDEDDEIEEPRPRRRSRAADDEDDEDRPRRRRTRAKDDDDYDDEKDDDEDALVIPIHRGRKEISKNRPVGEGGDSFFRWTDEEQVVKFLDTEPWSYDQHFVKRQGKQSFPCAGEGCPLCEIGVKVSQKVVYTLINLSHKGGPKVQTLEVGVTLDDTLAKYHEDKRTGPLHRLYWALSRTERSGGGFGKYNYIITPIKERDLEEDWEIDLDVAEKAVDEAEVPEPMDVTGKWTRGALQEIADEAMGR